MSGKGGGRRDDRKKPSAIIDLKATEVRSNEGQQGKPAASSASQPAKPAAPAGAPTGTASALKAAQPASSQSPEPPQKTASQAKAGPSKSEPSKSQTVPPTGAAAKTATSTAATASAAAKASQGGAKTSGTQGAGSGGREPPQTPPRPERSGGSGIWGTITHLIAALIGGAVVLYGGEQIARQAGLPVPERTAQVPEELTTRLAAIEQRVSAPAQAELPPAVSEQLGRIEEQGTTISGLRETIAKLEASQSELQARLEVAATGGAEGAGVSEDVVSRLGQLERTIETLAQAAGPDGTGGGALAQLTAVSGKLADLESTLQTQLAELRQSVMADVDKRMEPTAQASEAARSGTQRVDRELAEAKTEVARVAQRTEALSATADRIDGAVRAVSEETGKLTSDVAALKTDLAAQIATRATPSDIEGAVKPIGEKVASLESGLNSVLSSEASRKEDAGRIVLALQLADLKRALDRGGAFTEELQAVKAQAGDRIDVSALETFQSEGVPTVSRLAAELRAVSHDMIGAADTTGEDGSWMDQMLAGAKSIVRVRRTGETVGLDPNSAEALVAKLEQQITAGDLAAAAETAEALPGPSKAAAGDWIGRLKARAAVDTAIASIEADLKSSLTGDAPADNKS